MISLFIVLSCSWGNPTLKSLVGVSKMRRGSLWRLLWVSPHYGQKQRIIFFKLSKLLQSLLSPSREHSETYQLCASNPVHARPSLQFLPWLLLAAATYIHSPSGICYHRGQRLHLIKDDSSPQRRENNNDSKMFLPFQIYCSDWFLCFKPRICSICLLQTAFVSEEC